MLDPKPDERVLDVGCGIGVRARPNASCMILSSSQAYAELWSLLRLGRLLSRKSVRCMSAVQAITFAGSVVVQ